MRPSLTRAEHALSPAADAGANGGLEVSVVIPCLNEEDTLGACITKAQEAIRAHGLAAEIVVADNGSTDRSREIAHALGARVVEVPRRGYGAALMAGIEAAQGRFIIMADADDSYDLREIPRFVEHLRQGFDLVQGCRLPAGGGRIMPGAMPFLHRWWGNPMFSTLARVMFRSPVSDVYCGMRGFTRTLYGRLDQRCTGMEFATEMIIKASLLGVRIAEIPITLHPDGRRSHARHLRTFRDGWRTLRFFLMCSPRWLFLVPGGVLVVLGLLAYAAALPGLRIGGVHFDAHTLLIGSLALLLGYQTLVFALLAKTFAASEGLVPEDEGLTRILRALDLERGLLVSAAVLLTGLSLLALAVNAWRLAHFGDLDYARTMRLVVPGVTLAALGFQSVLASFLLSMLRMRRR